MYKKINMIEITFTTHFENYEAVGMILLVLNNLE